MHAGSRVIHVGFAHCGEGARSSPSRAMTAEQPDRERSSDAGTASGPRFSRVMLLVLMLLAVTLGVLRKETPLKDAWQLPVSGAAATAFLVLLAKSLDLLRRGTRERRP